MLRFYELPCLYHSGVFIAMYAVESLFAASGIMLVVSP